MKILITFIGILVIQTIPFILLEYGIMTVKYVEMSIIFIVPIGALRLNHLVGKQEAK